MSSLLEITLDDYIDLFTEELFMHLNTYISNLKEMVDFVIVEDDLIKFSTKHNVKNPRFIFGNYYEVEKIEEVSNIG